MSNYTDCYILKRQQKSGVIRPEDLLVLNKEGAVAIFPSVEEAWDFVDNNGLENAEVEFVKYSKTQNEPVLAKGTKVYIPTSLHVYRGKDDIQGGLATVKTIDYSEHLSPDHYNYIMVSFEELSQGERYNWRYLLEHQKEWEKEYKGLIVKPDPDYRPEFNCDDSDWH